MAVGRDARIRELLLKAKLVDELQLRSATAHVDQWGGRLTQALIELGFVEEDELTDALGKGMHMPVVHLGTVAHDADALSKLDAVFCETHLVFPLSAKDRVFHIAIADPTDVGTIDAVQAKVGVRVVVNLATEGEILSAIGRHYRGEEATSRSKNKARRVITAEAPDPTNEGELELDLSPAPAMKRTSLPPLDPVLMQPPGANTLLDDIMATPADELSPEETERLEAARANQAKSSTILRALEELLKEKGLR